MSEARRQRISQRMTRTVGLLRSLSKHFEEIERELENERKEITEELRKLTERLEQERRKREASGKEGE